MANSPAGIEPEMLLLKKLLEAVGAAPKSKPELENLLQDLGIGLVVRRNVESRESTKPQHTPIVREDMVPVGELSEAAAFDPVQEGLKTLARMRDAEGGSMTGAELLRHYHLTPATLHRRRKEHRIVFWQDARHGFHYPVWQFTATGSLIPGIQEVLRIFKSGNSTRVMRYFLGRRGQLEDKTPLECLRSGDKSKIIEHASRHYAEDTW
jgi:hypothetical protein